MPTVPEGFVLSDLILTLRIRGKAYHIVELSAFAQIASNREQVLGVGKPNQRPPKTQPTWETARREGV